MSCEAVEHLLVTKDAPYGLVLAAADFLKSVFNEYQPVLILQA